MSSRFTALSFIPSKPLLIPSIGVITLQMEERIDGIAAGEAIESRQKNNDQITRIEETSSGNFHVYHQTSYFICGTCRNARNEKRERDGLRDRYTISAARTQRKVH